MGFEALKALETDDMRSVLESLLLVATEPVETAVFAEMLGCGRDEAKAALEDLSAEYAELGRGFQLRYVAGGWRLYTHPSHDEVVRAFVKSWDTRKLSAAALETVLIYDAGKSEVARDAPQVRCERRWALIRHGVPCAHIGVVHALVAVLGVLQDVIGDGAAVRAELLCGLRNGRVRARPIQVNYF